MLKDLADFIDLLHCTCEHFTRTDFDEGVDTGSKHHLHAGAPTHWTLNLFRQLLFDLLRNL